MKIVANTEVTNIRSNNKRSSYVSVARTVANSVATIDCPSGNILTIHTKSNSTSIGSDTSKEASIASTGSCSRDNRVAGTNK